MPVLVLLSYGMINNNTTVTTNLATLLPLFIQVILRLLSIGYCKNVRICAFSIALLSPVIYPDILMYIYYINIDNNKASYDRNLYTWKHDSAILYQVNIPRQLLAIIPISHYCWPTIGTCPHMSSEGAPGPEFRPRITFRHLPSLPTKSPNTAYHHRPGTH